jgi:hypothetical protein
MDPAHSTFSNERTGCSVTLVGASDHSHHAPAILSSSYHRFGVLIHSGVCLRFCLVLVFTSLHILATALSGFHSFAWHIELHLVLVFGVMKECMMGGVSARPYGSMYIYGMILYALLVLSCCLLKHLSVQYFRVIAQGLFSQSSIFSIHRNEVDCASDVFLDINSPYVRHRFESAMSDM